MCHIQRVATLQYNYNENKLNRNYGVHEYLQTVHSRSKHSELSN